MALAGGNPTGLDHGQNSIDTTANHPFFLSLPPEIRLTIYEYVLTPIRSQEPHRPLCRLRLLWLREAKWGISPSSTASTRGIKPEGLALSCRKIYKELRTKAWQAWEATEVDLSSCVPIGAFSFFKNAKESYLQHLRFLRIDWAVLVEGLHPDLDARFQAMRTYLCTQNTDCGLTRLHCLVDTNYDAFIGVYESFVDVWMSLTNVETFEAEWTTKCRSSFEFAHKIELIRTHVGPSHRVTVQYDGTDYNYEYPTLIVSSSKDTSLDNRSPDLYPYVDRISDLE